MHYAEIPGVIVDVQRVGPSTGLPTRTQQCDLQLCAIASHGDTKQIMVIPATPKECFELMEDAFDLAEQFQTPVFVMLDLDLGMNSWVDDELQYKAPKYNRGKVLNKGTARQGREVGTLPGFGRRRYLLTARYPARTT